MPETPRQELSFSESQVREIPFDPPFAKGKKEIPLDPPFAKGEATMRRNQTPPLGKGGWEGLKQLRILDRKICR
jgi:hypothetical protein